MTALFTKHPTPGQVKTRLCPPLTPDQAARLAEAMLRDTVARCCAGAFRTALVFAPAERAPWFRRTFPELSDQRPQNGADLGERLARFAEEVFGGGQARSLVVVGSDQPLVPVARLDEAHQALEDGADCVLGPDHGGGYYLIGLARSVPALFTSVVMSSTGMCAATEAQARARGLRIVRLPPHGDVDVPADLVHLRSELEVRSSGEDFLAHTRHALADLLSSIGSPDPTPRT